MHKPKHCDNHIQKNDKTSDDYHDLKISESESSQDKFTHSNNTTDNEQLLFVEIKDEEEEEEQEIKKSQSPLRKLRITPERIRRNNEMKNHSNQQTSNTRNYHNSDTTENEQKKTTSIVQKSKNRNYPKMGKTIPCPESGCILMFRCDRSVLMHRKKVHGFIQRNICHICNREFKEQGNLKQHIQTHGDSKRYICSYCGKGFHLPYNLKEHVNMHTGARPYICSVCGKTFNRQTLRITHMRVRIIIFSLVFFVCFCLLLGFL